MNAFHSAHLNANGFWFVSLASGTDFDFADILFNFPYSFRIDCWYGNDICKWFDAIDRIIQSNQPHADIKMPSVIENTHWTLRICKKACCKVRSITISNVLFDKQRNKYWSSLSFLPITSPPSLPPINAHNWSMKRQFIAWNQIDVDFEFCGKIFHFWPFVNINILRKSISKFEIKTKTETFYGFSVIHFVTFHLFSYHVAF